MPDPQSRNSTPTEMTSFMARYFPWFVLVTGILALLPVLLFPRNEDMHLHEFGSILVLDSGRYKPLDSFARDALFPKAYRHTVPTDSEGTIAATPWLLSVLAEGLANNYRWVTIPEPDLQGFFGLQSRPNQVLFDVTKIPVSGLTKVSQLAQTVQAKGFNQLDPLVQRQIMTGIDIVERRKKVSAIEEGLASRKMDPLELKLFRIENDQVLKMLALEPRAGLRYSFSEIVMRPGGKEIAQFLKKVREASQRDSKTLDLVDTKALQLAQQLQSYSNLLNLEEIKMVPDPDHATWQTVGDALRKEEKTGKENPQAAALTNLLYLYAVNNTTEFNNALDKYLIEQRTKYPAETRLLGLELYYNDVNPFYTILWFYVLVFLLLCFSWFGWASEPLRRAALFLGLLALAIHSWGMITRMIIQGRPPVTNLYSSALFIGWGCVILAVGMEFFFRNTFALLVGSVLGCLTLLFAPYMLEDGHDSMAVLEAVLDTNFWLATHVVCITLGYTTTLVAGTIGLVYIVWGVFTRLMTKEISKVVGQMLYGVLCFATLLSFVGTVLGGIWADQSWGRFWGWDPKENGAVMIVIWNALILHARWGGLVKERGMAMLAVVGNMITGWSWAGTNQLGVGLHAYGFNQTLAMGLVLFWFSQLAVIGLAMVPQRHWLSFRPSYEPKMEPVSPGSPFKRRKRGLA